MHAIPNPFWGAITSYTWEDLSVHQWECFRTALFETVTEQGATGVAIDSATTATVVITELQPKGVVILQSPVIMQSRTEMITSIVVSERDYLTNMIKYLPLYERESFVINEILKSYDRELRNLEQDLEVTERNLLIDTAIEDLHIYERDLGIKSNPKLNYRQRREQIISRNIASFSQTTDDVIKAVAAAYSNGEVEINSISVPGVYEIKFVGVKGIPDNLTGLKEAVNIIAPAHLQFDYTFTYNTWEFVSDLTWGGVQHMSWSDLQTWDEVSQ